MVGAGKPQRIKALHTLKADKNILKCIIKGMTHVQLTCNIRGRNNYCIGILALLASGMEVSSIKPHFVDTVLNLTGIVLLS